MQKDRQPTQAQRFYAADRNVSDANILFMEMVREGTMTKATLAALLKRRPGKWDRFSGFLKTLPD